jgi:Acetyltransferase (GNAT) domain
MARVSVQKSDWRKWPEFAPTWERIHNLCPGASFFISRDWVDCWLATFGSDLNPDLLTFVRDGDVVGCCLLVWRKQWIRGVPLRRVYLNCAGENEADSTCIEYNSLLSLPDCAEEVAEALGSFLRSRRWDEFVLQGMGGDSPLCTVARSLGINEISVRPSHYVDLSSIRGNAAGLDSVLSSNSRQQIRRAQRLYEADSGSCTLNVARTAEEAGEIFARLAGLHQTAWQDRGRPGVFSSSRFTGFHHRLIQAGFAHDRIMLVEARAGARVIGALYSFLHRGRVDFYQSGFQYSADGRLKPGLLTHYLAIRHCLEQTGLREYDFLAGDSQYKRSLATASRALSWTVVRRLTVPTFLFFALRWLKRKYVQILKRSRRKDQPDGRVERSADVSVPYIGTGGVVGKRGE